MKKIFFIFATISFVISLSFFYIERNFPFRFLIEDRTNFYYWSEETNMIEENKIENLMYCKNENPNNFSIECGFYINGIKFNTGEER